MLRVRLFGELRERAGWSERTVEGAHAPTPSQVWEAIAADCGEQPVLPARIRVAVNQQFAEPTAPLHDGDEVAFLPPISGG
jgi:molybdopterin converting factor subunit 1